MDQTKGYHHAYANAVDEEKAAADAMAFTIKLKEKGKKYWEELDKSKKKNRSSEQEY